MNISNTASKNKLERSIVPIITQYVYDKARKRAKLGAILTEDGKIRIAWSVWHPKKDKYNKNGFDQVLFGRLAIGTKKDPPFVIRKDLIKFADRAKRYFKTNQFTEGSIKALELCLPEAILVD